MYKNIFIAFAFTALLNSGINAQCVNASFSIPDTVCAGQILPITNTSTGSGLSYEWDFCPIDMTFPNNLTAGYNLNGYGFTSLNYFKYVKDSNQYITLAFDTATSQFVIAKTANDITTWYVAGNAPVANPYTITGFPKANCFDVIKEGNTWYGLAAYAPNNSLALLTFTNGFNGVPAASAITTITSLNSPASVKLVKHDGNYFAFITNRADNGLVCLSFGSSMTNAPAQVYKSILSGANGLNDIDIMPVCDSITGFASNLNSGNLLKLYFDNDFTIPPIVATVPTTAAGTNGVAMAKEANNYYVYFTGSDTIFRLAYGNDFNSTPVQIKYTWGYPEFRDVEVLQDSSRNLMVFVTDFFNFFVHVPFPSTPCFQNYFTTDTVPNFSFNNTGTYSFSLTAHDTLGSFSSQTQSVVVVSGSALPQFSFVNTCFSLTDSISFIDLSTGSITGYNWDFGDGNFSSLQNPKHKYAAPGNYTVTLTISTASGCAFVISKNVLLNSLPVVSFSSTITCAKSATQFIDLSTITSGSIAGWNWLFGDGDSASTQNPAHIYNTGGTYNVTVTVSSDSGCTSSATLPVTVDPSPLVSFTSANACVGDTSSFTNTTTIAGASTITYQWFFGDGGSSSLTDPTHAYAGAGSYPLTLIATASNGCVDSLNTSFVVSTPATPDFSFPVTNCSGNNVAFIDLSTGGVVTNWLWDFGDGDSSIIQNPQHAYIASGTYNVSLRVSIGSACFSTLTKQITISPGPTAQFNSTEVCEGSLTFFTDLSSTPAGQNITTYNWSFGDGNISSQQNPTNDYNAAGTYNSVLIITTDLGCIDSVTNSVIVNSNPVVSFSSPNLVCEGEPIQFTDNSSVIGNVITGWLWSFGDGTLSNQQNPVKSYANGGSYLVILTATSFTGCASANSAAITVNAAPQFTFTAADGCLGTQTNFSFNPIAVAPFGFQWFFGDGGQAFIANPQHTYLTSGNFPVSLTVVDSGGCEATYVDTVTVNAVPDAAFIQNGICQNTPVSFTNFTTIGAGTISGYLWNFGDGTTSTDTSPIHSFANAITYQVVLYATATGGCTDSSKQNVTIKPLPQVSFTTTGFSSPGIISSFTNNTSGAVSYVWNFGDGSALSNLINPTHIFSDTGSFIVTLTAQSNFGCVDSFNASFSVLEPYLDLGIKNVSTSLSNDLLSLKAEIINNGNIKATSYLLQVSLNGMSTILETSHDTIAPAQLKNYSIGTQFKVNQAALPSYYCIKILKVNGANDNVESNNLKCAPLATVFNLAEIAPNPVSSQLNLNYFLPLDDVVIIELYDARGRKTQKLLFAKQSKGLHQESFNIATLSKGVYFCKITYRDEVIKRRFLKF